VTNWDHDGFGASGRGINGGCTDVRFIRCKAVNTPRCIKAWEIEEGAQRVRLEDCRIENLGGTGTGFYVRHHAYRWPLLVDDVEFVRCSVSNISGQGFLIVTVPLSRSTIRPYIRTRNVRLIDCTSDAPVTIGVGVEDVKVQGGRFGALMGIGLYAAGSERAPLANAPARSVTIEDATVREIKINANTGNGSGVLEDKHYPDYEPRIRLRRVTAPGGVEILGPEENVAMDACRIGGR